VPIDSRRETQHIQREMMRYHQQVGENVVWFKFDVDNSLYDRVYDEGGRAYHHGLNVPTLWIDQGEAPEQYLQEGRRPVMTLRFAVWARALSEVHVGLQEAHGHRVFDRGLIGGKWFDDRLNDIVYYDGRYWEVDNFQIRGRIREDNIVGVTCTETYPEDEYVFDFPSGSTPPPIPVEKTGYGYGQYGSGPYGGAL
jgi:hypothetical protein